MAAERIAGVDEAGRGPLAGPVTVAAVVLDSNQPIIGLDDSKRLTAKRRETLFTAIQEQALCWSIIHVDAPVIDELNILRIEPRENRDDLLVVAKEVVEILPNQRP